MDRERASVLRCTYIACLFNIVFAVMNEMIKLLRIKQEEDERVRIGFVLLRTVTNGGFSSPQR